MPAYYQYVLLRTMRYCEEAEQFTHHVLLSVGHDHHPHDEDSEPQDDEPAKPQGKNGGSPEPRSCGQLVV